MASEGGSDDGGGSKGGGDDGGGSKGDDGDDGGGGKGSGDKSGGDGTVSVLWRASFSLADNCSMTLIPESGGGRSVLGGDLPGS